MYFYRLNIAALLLFLSGCCDKKPINLSVAKQEIVDYYASGAFDKEVERTVAAAFEHFKHQDISKIAKPVVLFDVDDTVLSNYEDMRDIQFGYIPKLFHDWVLRADAPAVLAVKRLYDYLLDRGYRVIFLTGRRYDEYDATLKNLNNNNFTGFDRLIVRPADKVTISAHDYKAAEREKLVQAGYTILGSVGDQESDMRGSNVGYPVKLPNYTYVIQ